MRGSSDTPRSQRSRAMDGKLIVSVLALVISIVSFGLSSWVALRDRARVELVVRKGPANDFTSDKTSFGTDEVLAIQVLNLGRRPVTLAPTNPLRLIRADGSVMGVPEDQQTNEDAMTNLVHVYGRPFDGRLGENDGFVVMIRPVDWAWKRLDGLAPIVGVQVVDVTGRVRAKAKLPRPLVQWFNGDKQVIAVRQEIQNLVDRERPD